MTARPPRHARPPMLTVAQAADRLGLSKMQVYRYIGAGDLAAVQYPSRSGKPDGPIRVDPAEVEAFIRRHAAAAT